MQYPKDIYDCLIVGGGSAGLSAALTLGRARRRVLVCDQGHPRNASAPESHGFLTRDGINPLELLNIAREQLRPYQSVEFQTLGVCEIFQTGASFEAVFENGTRKRARKILFAFGVADEFPNIENFGDFWGQSVFHCPFCHGFEVKDQPLAVVGNGAVAIGMTALLKNWSTDLVLCTNGPAELSAEQRQLLGQHGVVIHEQEIVRLEGQDGHLKNVVFDTGQKIARGAMLIRLKQKLRCNLAEKLGCELNELGFIQTTGFNETTVRGVYAAGDVTSPMQSIAVAVSQGALSAGAGITHALSEEDFCS